MSRIIYTEELISTFRTKMLLRYPHLDPKDIEKVCRAQFRMAKEVIEYGDLEEIRLQYLFVLRVSPQKIIKQLAFMSNYVPGRTMDADKYNYYLSMIFRFIKNNQDKFTDKHDSKIKDYTGKTIREISAREYPDNGY
jgi:hypothetical protein